MLMTSSAGGGEGTFIEVGVVMLLNNGGVDDAAGMGSEFSLLPVTNDDRVKAALKEII